MLAIDNAVVFATEESLMAITGGQVQKLSLDIDGQPSGVGSYSRKMMGIAGLTGIVSNEEFRDYLNDAGMGFNYHRREIVVSNPNKSYSYAYNISSGTWSKLSGVIGGYVRNSYPECLFFKGDSVYNMENPAIKDNNILLITRPVKMGELSHKKVFQSALRGLFRTNRLGCYLLGSNDTQNYTVLSGRETGEDIRDLVTAANRSRAYKYYVICITGYLRSDSQIDFIEMLAEESFGNRLR